MRLRDKRAIITAAGSGMGRAAAARFAKEGARVAVVDIAPDAAEGTVRLINDAGGTAKAFVADLSDSARCRSLIGETAGWLGGLDILWNHTGIPGTSAFEDITDADFQYATDVNVRSAYLLSGAAVTLLREEGGGAILFTSSTSGLVGASTSPLYAVGKFGIVGLAKSLALRLAPDNIRVNALCPGPIRTAMTRQFFRTDDEELMSRKEQGLIAAVPLGRFGRAEEVAAAGLFLASDEASFITGVALPVDGGFLAR